MERGAAVFFFSGPRILQTAPTQIGAFQKRSVFSSAPILPERKQIFISDTTAIEQFRHITANA